MSPRPRRWIVLKGGPPGAPALPAGELAGELLSRRESYGERNPSRWGARRASRPASGVLGPQGGLPARPPAGRETPPAGSPGGRETVLQSRGGQFPGQPAKLLTPKPFTATHAFLLAQLVRGDAVVPAARRSRQSGCAMRVTLRLAAHPDSRSWGTATARSPRPRFRG